LSKEIGSAKTKRAKQGRRRIRHGERISGKGYASSIMECSTWESRNITL
jgi:hypothetical protein